MTHWLADLRKKGGRAATGGACDSSRLKRDNLSEDDIKSKLGAPIYSRFDEIIKFNDISEDGIKRIIKIEFDKQYSQLTFPEQEIVDNKNVLLKILTNASYLKNARDIRKIIRQAISTSILSQIL